MPVVDRMVLAFTQEPAKFTYVNIKRAKQTYTRPNLYSINGALDYWLCQHLSYTNRLRNPLTLSNRKRKLFVRVCEHDDSSYGAENRRKSVRWLKNGNSINKHESSTGLTRNTREGNTYENKIELFRRPRHDSLGCNIVKSMHFKTVYTFQKRRLHCTW